MIVKTCVAEFETELRSSKRVCQVSDGEDAISTYVLCPHYFNCGSSNFKVHYSGGAMGVQRERVRSVMDGTGEARRKRWICLICCSCSGEPTHASRCCQRVMIVTLQMSDYV